MSVAFCARLVAGCLPLVLAVAACTRTPSPAPSAAAADGGPAGASSGIQKATVCKGGEMTYLGFRGVGQPPLVLLDEIRKRFPDAAVYEVSAGKLGVFIAEPHSMDVRSRHEAAAAAVGWKGDVVDFASVTKTCEAAFHTPMPPPRRPTP
jgi:hypothetical protein